MGAVKGCTTGEGALQNGCATGAIPLYWSIYMDGIVRGHSEVIYYKFGLPKLKYYQIIKNSHSTF